MHDLHPSSSQRLYLEMPGMRSGERALEVVQCRSCKGQFDVKGLQHRRTERESGLGKEAARAETLPLFAVNDEIPF